MSEPTGQADALADLAARAVVDALALPEGAHEQAAATLLVDLDAGTVVFANLLATQLAPDVRLPAPLAEWARAAGLRTQDGLGLDEGLRTLATIAREAPSRGIQVSAERATGDSALREALWVVGVPLAGAPAPLAHQALVVLLPLRSRTAAAAMPDLGTDVHARAAVASSVSFTITDPTQPGDPIVWVNPAFERVTGYRAEDVIGTNCRFLQGPDTDREVVARIRAALEARTTVADTLLNYRADGTPFWNQVVISPVLDADGHVTHHVGIQADVTERVQALLAREAALDEARVSSRRLHLLAEVSQTLAEHLDYTDAVRALAQVAVPRLASWGFVAVVDERGRFDGLHIVAADPVDAIDAAELERADLGWLTRSPRIAHALASPAGHVPVASPVDVASLAARTTPRQLALLHRLGLGSALVVPLRARDGVLGVLVLVVRDRHDLLQENVITAAHLGHRAGVGLDNVRLYQREREAAVTLQRSLLPELPEIPGLDVAAAYVPALDRAQVGGDWFDVLPLPDGAVGLAVGDVVGHDLHAAASMGQLRSVLRSYAWSGQDAGTVVARLDELVQGLGMADIATCVYLRLEGSTLRYTRAGHPPPFVRTADGVVRELDGALTTPVGVPVPGRPVVEAAVDLPPGAVLVVYTDGLLERRSRPLRRGIAELRATLEAMPDGMDARGICDHLVATLAGGEHEDDVCVLVVRRDAEPD
ncbi:SpoIIE family protein phosphatase [Actinotalea sp. JY-7876]|uniref:SpoIIE family protein phosphatase n=1 Tax=Actinotalea sp. JY-7876 TaxID=2758442 RepID=UPI0021032AC2|nr:SpoIIE family protein phosphatase [Actinotalea sp. JY-7876]